MSETIELTDAQTKRFRKIKEECKDDHTPEPTDELMISSLMDTWDGVNMGIYTEDHTPNDELRELVERWKEGAEYAKDVGNLKEYDGIMSCHDELEAVLEE